MNQPQPPYDEPAYPPAQPNYPIPPQPVDAEQPGYPAEPPAYAEPQFAPPPQAEPVPQFQAQPQLQAEPAPQFQAQPQLQAQSPSQPPPLQATAEPVAPPPSLPADPTAAELGPPATTPLQPDHTGYQHRPQPGPTGAPEQGRNGVPERGRTGGLAAPPPAPAPVMDPHPHNATDWTYTPRQTSVTNRPTPAEWGWRARLRELSGGVLKLAPGPDELLHRAAIARIRSTLPGSRTVVVANEKGGAGKTPTALILSALLAEYRREAVVAWDVNELRGTLGLRAEITEPPLTVTDVLAASSELARPEAEVGVLSAYLRRQPQGNLVLASSEDGNAMRQIGHAECDIVRQLLLRRYGVVVCDTGNNAAAPNFLYTVDSADVLVLPTAPSDVHLEVARAMLRMLASRSTTSHLVSRAVLVVTSSTGARLEPEEERWFTDRIGRVVHVPADPIIAQGGKLTIAELSQTSIRAWTQVAGAVIEAALAPSPHDRPRGRRRAPDGAAASPLASPPQPSIPAQPAMQPLSEVPQPSTPVVAPAAHQEQLNRQPPPLSAGWIPVTQPPGSPPPR